MPKQARTKKQVISRLNALTDGDAEAAHIEADKLLTDALLIANMADVVVRTWLRVTVSAFGMRNHLRLYGAI